MDHYNRIEREMQAHHDRYVSTLSLQTMKDALRDLSTKPRNGKDPDARWVRHRIAAIQRKLYAPELVR